jgi:hypothetical protein
MNAIKIFAAIALISAWGRAGEIRIVRVHGDIAVRHNVQEQWVKAAAADLLKPDDTMKSGKGSNATILVENGRKIEVPELVVVDVADLRQLTQEELLLKLATDRLLSAPPQKEGTAPPLKSTTTVGSNMEESALPRPGNQELSRMELNGSRLLYRNGYYATCVLKSKEIWRLSPALAEDMDARIMVADALEKMHLRGEARGEYLSIPREKLTPEQKAVVDAAMGRLKKKG